MYKLLLVFFWIGIAVTIVNSVKHHKEEKSAAASEEARKAALSEKLSRLREEGESNAEQLINKLKDKRDN